MYVNFFFYKLCVLYILIVRNIEKIYILVNVIFLIRNYIKCEGIIIYLINDNVVIFFLLINILVIIFIIVVLFVNSLCVILDFVL